MSKSNLQDVTTFSIHSIMKLLKWVFALTYCEYNGNYYRLECGPIGLSVVGEVAIIYMEDFQMRAKSTEYPELNEWPWYVDDSLLKCKRYRANTILSHLNSIEPDVIKFTLEEEKDNKIGILDLELIVNRKNKKIEFNVHYKPTATNITIKKRSNHPESTKQGIIKSFTDRANALCDPIYLPDEIKNIKEIFVENGYTEEEVNTTIRKRSHHAERKNDENRGVIVLPNIPNFSAKFSKIARQHKFKIAYKTQNQVKDLKSKAKAPLGERKSKVVYNIPCKCRSYSYTGETKRQWKTRKKEHEDKVRLTNEDIAAGNIDTANRRMNEGDGGLAKHASTCLSGIDWQNAKIVNHESGWSPRKFLEGIESLREKNSGKIPLNSYNQLEQWQSTLYPLFGR